MITDVISGVGFFTVGNLTLQTVIVTQSSSCRQLLMTSLLSGHDVSAGLSVFAIVMNGTAAEERKTK